MDPILSSPLRRPETHLPVRSLFLVLAAATVLPLWAIGTESPRVPPPAVQPAPPAYPDASHVPEGCYISTLAYLARFRTEFPAEKGAPLTVMLRSFGGPHTIALVTWHGGWWGRDEYSAVFDLQCAVTQISDVERLRATAEFILSKLSSRQLKSGRISAAKDALGELSDRARLEAVRAAATLLPCASQIHWVRCSRGDIPLLFFQPAEGTIAVYDPASGTATAECVLRSIPTVVTMVASQLGYKVRGVWSDSQLASTPMGR